MNLYLLKHKKDEKNLYDVNYGFVIRADNPKRARILANRKISDERLLSKDFWLNSKLSSCRKLCSKGKEMIILQDYNAG